MASVWNSEFTHGLISNLLKLFDIPKHQYQGTYKQTQSLIRRVYRKPGLEIMKTVCDSIKWPLAKPDPQRAPKRAAELTSLLKGFTPKKGYLDLGCGDGSITALIGKQYGFAPGQIYGVDIYPVVNPEITYAVAQPDGCIKLPDATVDLATAIVSFHHIEQLDKTLSELARVMADGGHLIIREHDTTRAEQNAEFIDYIHAMIKYLNVGEFNEHFETWEVQSKALTQYMASINYKSASQWTELLADVGFELVETSTYTVSNPQKLYFALYKLKK